MMRKANVSNAPMTFFLTTERLGFRRWNPSDTDLAFALWGDPNVIRLIDARPRLTPDETHQILLDHCAWQATFGIQYWPMVRLEDHAFVGCCGFRPHDKEQNIPELGFHICSEFWKNGYAKEGAAAVIDLAFSHLGFQALYAGHHPENIASAHILNVLGFTRTGAELYHPTGLMHPTCILTKEAYLRIRNTQE